VYLGLSRRFVFSSIVRIYGLLVRNHSATTTRIRRTCAFLRVRHPSTTHTFTQAAAGGSLPFATNWTTDCRRRADGRLVWHHRRSNLYEDGAFSKGATLSRYIPFARHVHVLWQTFSPGERLFLQNVDRKPFEKPQIFIYSFVTLFWRCSAREHTHRQIITVFLYEKFTKIITDYFPRVIWSSTKSIA